MLTSSKKIFTETSQIMFDQISGHHCPSKLTHKKEHVSAMAPIAKGHAGERWNCSKSAPFLFHSAFFFFFFFFFWRWDTGYGVVGGTSLSLFMLAINWQFCFLGFFVVVVLFCFFFLVFCLFRAAPTAHGGSQDRGLIGATAAGLYHSHGNTRSEPHLWSTPQLTAMLDP